MIKKIDHIVITARDPKACLEFYSKLGFSARSESGRPELFAGDFKINVHTLGKELSPHAMNVQTGSADICLEWAGDISRLIEELRTNGIEIELGVVERRGVRGKMQSIYMRDPDGNLVEICSYK